MSSEPRRALIRPSSLIIAASCALSLSACAAAPSARIKIGAAFRQPCAGPTSPMRTGGDKDALLIGYETSLQDCEAKRAGLVNLIDAAAPKRRWWQFRKPES